VTAGSTGEPRFNPKRAAAIVRRQRLKRFLLYSVFLVVGVVATATFYEIRNSYENCILRSMPGAPERAVALIRESCRRIAW
jgi:hypothetical protein